MRTKTSVPAVSAKSRVKSNQTDTPQVFRFETKVVRVVIKDGEPWWVLADVCKVLDLSNPTVVADRLDLESRAKFDLGRQGEAAIVNESGLYAVIFRSDKPEAKKFQKWVFGEVLPQIRKNGSYGAATPALPKTYLEALRELTAQVERNEALEGKIERFGHQVQQLIPHLELNMKLQKPRSNFLMDGSQVAKLFNTEGFGRNKLFRYCREWGWIMQNCPEPTQDAINRRLVEPHTVLTDVRPNGEVVPHIQTLFTYKGIKIALKKLLDIGEIKPSERIDKIKEALEECLKDGVYIDLERLTF